MRAILLLLVTFSTGALISQDKKVEETGKSPVVTKVSSGGRIRMELCSSGIELLGHEEDTLRVSYDPERGNVKVRIQVAGDQTELSESGPLRCHARDHRRPVACPPRGR